MALALGKLTILIGAGVAGAVLAKEQRLPGFSDVFSGAYKILRHLKRGDSTSSSASKPRNDTLLAQVNSLQEELKILVSSRPITIVTGSERGASRYGLVIIIVVVGYGYVWWKGFKLPDMMFATRRGLDDACNSVARQLEGVYSSLSATKLHLSKKIDNVDVQLDENQKVIECLHEEASALQESTDDVSGKFQAVHDFCHALQTRVSMMEEKQGFLNQGVAMLCDRAATLEMENSKKSQQKQALPFGPTQPALELPPATPSRTESMPGVLSLEPPSPSYLRESQGSFQEPISPESSNSSSSAKSINSSSGLYGLVAGFGGPSGSFVTKTRSATNAFPVITRSGRLQLS